MGFWPLAEAVLRNADIIIVVSDVRLPEMSMNKEIERKLDMYNKRTLYVLTKIDLVSSKTLEEKKKEYPNAFFISATKNIGVGKLRRAIQVVAKGMGLEEPSVGVVGYPNIGKSALINALARRAKAAVADVPGTTRGIQWVKAGGIKILDTPGVIPYEDKGSKLALIGSKSPEKIVQKDIAALRIIDMFLGKNKKALEDRFHITANEDDDSYDIMLQIGAKRGLLKKKGVVDETKTCMIIIREWQKGLLKL